MSKKDHLAKIMELHRIFHAGGIPTIPNHEVHPVELEKGSRERYLYFTLAPSLNFQRNSPALWAAALKTWEDSDTRYLFFPEEVINRKREDIQRDLSKHRLSLQKNKHTDIWIRLSETFYKYFSSNPKDLMEAGQWDVLKIQQIVQVDKRREFPYLCGPKMANYWLYILSQYTDASFVNMREISIIPDTHVQQCSIKLGLTKADTKPLEVAKAWKELLEESPLSPVEMHPVLWTWSRNNFSPGV